MPGGILFRNARVFDGESERLRERAEVLVRGELWTAHCPQGARKGDAVVVRGFHELTLEVEPRR